MRFEHTDFVVEYERHGDGAPLLFLHGLAADRRLLVETFEPAFATGAPFQRVYVDLPGHGLSPPAPRYASADGLAEVCAELAHGLFGERSNPAIIGYSYGGYLAPLLVPLLTGSRGLFLVAPVVEPDFAKRRPAPRRTLIREAALRFSNDPRERTAFDEVAVVQTQTVLDGFQRLVHPANVGADQAFIAAVRERYATVRPILSLLQPWDRPVSIVAGRDDHWVGYEDPLTLMGAIPRAELHVLPDCGHLLPLEQPLRLRSLFSEWLSRLV